MKVVVRQKYKSFNAEVAKLGTLDDFKKIIATREKVAPTQVHVVFKRKILIGNPKLQDIGITEGSLVDIVISRSSIELTFSHPEELRLTKLPDMKSNEGPSVNAREAFIQQEKIRILMNMGFQVGQAKLALQLADGDVQIAGSYFPLDDEKAHLIKPRQPNTEPEAHKEKSPDRVIEPPVKVEIKTKVGTKDVGPVSEKKFENTKEHVPTKVKSPPKMTKEEETIVKVREFLSNPNKFKLVYKILTKIYRNGRIRKDPEAIIELVKARQEEKKELKSYAPTQIVAIKRIMKLGLPYSATIKLLNQTNWDADEIEQYYQSMRAMSGQSQERIPTSTRPVVQIPTTGRGFRMPNIASSLARNAPDVNPQLRFAGQEDNNFPVAPESLPREVEEEEEEDNTHFTLRPRGGFKGRR